MTKEKIVRQPQVTVYKGFAILAASSGKFYTQGLPYDSLAQAQQAIDTKLKKRY